jgi:hypothetical protein
VKRVITAVWTALILTAACAATAASSTMTDRHATAVAQAKAMVAAAPTLPDASQSETPPNADMSMPFEYPGIDDLVKRHAYWTVDEPYDQAYADLTAATPDGYSVYVTTRGGGKHYKDNSRGTDYELNTLPDGIYYAHLLLFVEPITRSSSGISAFAEVVASVPRKPREIVPSTVHRVVLKKYGHYGDKHPLRRVQRGHDARQTVADFDALMVDPGTETSCPNNPRIFTATFRVDGVVWIATLGCPGVGVTRNGHDLQYLSLSGGFYKDVVSHLHRNP